MFSIKSIIDRLSRKAQSTPASQGEQRLLEIENILRQGPISALDINRKVHTTEARKYISILRQRGIPVTYKWKVVGPKGNKVRFKLYWIG